MPNKPIKIVGRVPSGRTKNDRVFTPQALEKMVDGMNKRAAEGRLVGQIELPYDGRTRLNQVSHKVLPGVKLNDNGSVTAEIEILPTPMGGQLQAMLEHSPHRMIFSLRGFGCAPDHINVTGVDVSVSSAKDWTVLDGICDALDNEEKNT